MKFSLLFAVFLLSCHGLKARNAELDSLLKLLKNTREDTAKLELLSDIADIAPDGEWQKYSEQMGTLAQKLMKSSDGKIQWAGKKHYAVYLNNTAFGYFEKGDFRNALDYYSRSMKMSENIGDNENVSLVLSNIGAIYDRQGDAEKAIEVYQKALILQEKANDANQMVATLLNIGALYNKRNILDSALIYCRKSLRLIEQYKFKNHTTTTLYTNLGFIMESKAEFQKAHAYYITGLSIAEVIGDKSGISGNMKGLASVYFATGETPKALPLARQALSLAKEIENPRDIQRAAALLKRIYQEQGNYHDAFDMYVLETSMRDSLNRSDNEKAVLRHQFQYEYDLKEAVATAEQEKKDILQRTIRNTIAGVLAGVLVFLVVVYRQRNKISKARQRSDELLLNILPGEVAEELKAKGSAEARQYEEVSVMFTDFKGFTQISEKLTPAELVSEIDTCFRAFDDIIGRHRIEKIKTIGDSYMCAGGLPLANTTHAGDIVSAALEIQQFMQQHLMQRKMDGIAQFEVRIGIHTGPVVAGIVGARKFAYDIWGDTVNTASRMESSGEAGKVNISSATFERVKDKFHCTHRGKIQAKNKGEIDMYFVE